MDQVLQFSDIPQRDPPASVANKRAFDFGPGPCNFSSSECRWLSLMAISMSPTRFGYALVLDVLADPTQPAHRQHNSNGPAVTLPPRSSIRRASRRWFANFQKPVRFARARAKRSPAWPERLTSRGRNLLP